MTVQPLHPISDLRCQAASLLLFQSVLEDAVGQAFLRLLDRLSEPAIAPVDCWRAYGAWFRALAEEQQSWAGHLMRRILWDTNPFTQAAAKGQDLSPVLYTAARHDLQILHNLSGCPEAQIYPKLELLVPGAEPLVPWQLEEPLPRSPLTRDTPWSETVADLAAYYHQNGTGLVAEFRAFRWQMGQLRGIAHPDPVQLGDLVGYEWQQEALIQNTEFLLAGYPALHVLLYGSRGSGKSSLVKALLNRYSDRGLRLIEIAKAELQQLPEIVESLRDWPQKFILFVDDLSFEEAEADYKALKVVLEGNVTARATNTVVYATSNRRHLIREFFGDRPAPKDNEEIHAWDTVQEKLSFSDRFGLTFTFEPADQPTYLEIIRHLAQQAHLSLSPEDLEFRALQWATRHNGRSGRTARQFIDFLKAELSLNP